MSLVERSPKATALRALTAAGGSVQSDTWAKLIDIAWEARDAGADRRDIQQRLAAVLDAELTEKADRADS